MGRETRGQVLWPDLETWPQGQLARWPGLCGARVSRPRPSIAGRGCRPSRGRADSSTRAPRAAAAATRRPPALAASACLDPAISVHLQSSPCVGRGPVGTSAISLTESIRRMSRRYVNQLSHGDSIDESYLVADKQLRANRQGNLYLQLELRDKTGTDEIGLRAV